MLGMLNTPRPSILFSGTGCKGNTPPCVLVWPPGLADTISPDDTIRSGVEIWDTIRINDLVAVFTATLDQPGRLQAIIIGAPSPYHNPVITHFLTLVTAHDEWAGTIFVVSEDPKLWQGHYLDGSIVIVTEVASAIRSLLPAPPEFEV